MILIDTSVWIDLFRQRRTKPASYLRQVLDEGRPFALTPLIVQEVLQGAADAKEFSLLHDYLTTQQMIVAHDPLEMHGRAAKLYFDCRRRGFTPRSTIDCVIAQAALDAGIALLHNDRDFEQIAAVAQQLKLI